MPAIELFKFMDMELEKERHEIEQEKARMYIAYLSNIFSQPLQEKPSSKFLQSKKEFEKLITPEFEDQKKQSKVYEWDFEREEREQIGNERG